MLNASDFEDYESNQTPAQITSFWTPEEMSMALPVPLEVPQGGPPSTEGTERPPANIQPAGQPPVTEGGAVSAIFTAAPVATPSLPPFSSVGKLFLVMNGVPMIASAAVIFNRTLLTAAHAVFNVETHQFAEFLLFAPAYDGGNMPLGSWPAASAVVAVDYATTGDLGRDLAMITTFDPIAASTGSLDLVIQQGTDLFFEALGYPANPSPPYDGSRMWACMGSGTGFDSTNGISAVGMQSNFQGGASGGPWLIGANNQINGLTSYGYSQPGQPEILYSPYFDQWVIDMFLLFRH